MKNLSKEAEKIMTERFGKDTVIALATCVELTDGLLLSHGTRYEF